LVLDNTVGKKVVENFFLENKMHTHSATEIISVKLGEAIFIPTLTASTPATPLSVSILLN